MPRGPMKFPRLSARALRLMCLRDKSASSSSPSAVRKKSPNVPADLRARSFRLYFYTNFGAKCQSLLSGPVHAPAAVGILSSFARSARRALACTRWQLLGTDFNTLRTALPARARYKFWQIIESGHVQRGLI